MASESHSSFKEKNLAPFERMAENVKKRALYISAHLNAISIHSCFFLLIRKKVPSACQEDNDQKFDHKEERH